MIELRILVGLRLGLGGVCLHFEALSQQDPFEGLRPGFVPTL